MILSSAVRLAECDLTNGDKLKYTRPACGVSHQWRTSLDQLLQLKFSGTSTVGGQRQQPAAAGLLDRGTPSSFFFQAADATIASRAFFPPPIQLDHVQPEIIKELLRNSQHL